MKRIFLLTTVILVWGSAVLAGELKIAVPVDEFKQLKSRLEALEKENGQLKQNVTPGASVSSGSASVEMQNRLQVVENENSRLRQELDSLKVQERPTQAGAEVQSRLESVEKENRQLKESMARSSDKGSGAEDAGLAGKLEAAENENSKLQQEVKLLKEGGVAEAYAENKISAREQYFLERRKNASHVYKF